MRFVAADLCGMILRSFSWGATLKGHESTFIKVALILSGRNLT